MRRFTGFIALIIGLAALKLAGPFLCPIVFGLLVAAVSAPMVQWLRRHKIPVGLAAFLVLLLDMAVIGGLGGILYAASSDLKSELPNIIENAQREAQRLTAHLPQSLVPKESLKPSGEALSGVAASFAEVAEFITVALLIIFFALLELNGGFTQRLATSTPGVFQHAETVEKVLKDVRAYLKVKLFTSTMMAIGTFITFKVFGLPMAILFTVMMFVFHFIPNIGALVVVVASLAIGVASKGAGPGIGAAVVLTVLTGIIGNVVEPLMMSRTLSLSPLTVVFGLLLWGWLWGPIGALISIPLMLMTKVVLEETRLAWLGELMGEKPKPEPWVERLRARGGSQGRQPHRPPHPRPSA